ncbi:outer membrane protein assembly factor BamA [Uliginosibacterium sp. 31-16]|uniref:outer membrane protein assembly factor BamA n=1 Tax=Uliginosibacterium sp. 31-16 TaxID=3068315 RepID=UPI00273F8E5F|nr:outer membrane protein assembly factor BamA [Uliginosibacterium sp. 31-16]MDP5240517.1 outer membrane protein assembly factor BamA [Uliginosibacterium sp. 31-16]
MSKTFTAIQIGVLALLSPLAFAYSPFVVKDIRVEGIQRTEAGTVFNYLPIRIGDSVGEDQVAKAVKALYATGFYRDVRIDVDKDVLVVIVDERPAIAQVDFSGNKTFDSKDLLKGLKEIGVVESRTFDRSQLDKAEQEIKRLYLTRSYYGVSVKTTVSPLERNRVAINFEIIEGDVAKIKSIRVIGAKAFRESRLLDLMTLEESGGVFNWFRHDKYSKQELQADVEELKSWYLDRGYLNFAIESTQVSITPDKKDVYISIAINEGEQYKISSVKMAGELLLPEAELRKLVTLKSGEIYSRSRVNETTRIISDRLGNDGYAFANVNAAPELDEEKREVALTLFVDPGRRAYVNRINVVGNNRSRDEVIRREMLQMESAWFDRQKVDRSKVRVDRTGFFEDVSIDTVPVTGAADQVDLNVSVKERATGSLSLGVGYSASEKLGLMGSIAQNNLFGSGNALSLSVNTGKVNRAATISFENPYWTEDGVSRGFDVYSRRTDTRSLAVAGYKSDSLGTGIRFGVPIALDDRVFLGLSVDQTKIETYSDSPQLYKDFIKEFGCKSADDCTKTSVTTATLLSTLGWMSDKRNSATYPTSGTYQRFNFELAIPPADMRYGRLSYQWQRYIPLTSTYTLMFNSDFGFAEGYGGKPVPFYKNYYAGGIGTIRGYKDNSIGPKSESFYSDGSTSSVALGGTRRATGGLEFLFPMPGVKEKDRSLRLSAFLDAGILWDDKYSSFTVSDIRYSTGFGMSWLSPIGPLKFSLGFPLRKQTGDEVQRFQFLIGSVM